MHKQLFPKNRHESAIQHAIRYGAKASGHATNVQEMLLRKLTFAVKWTFCSGGMKSVNGK